MPIYEYACQACGHQLDALQKVSDSPLRKCPECGALRLKRLISAPQFRLKGTGWYETDFKKNGQKRLADKGEEKPATEKPAAEKGDKADAAKPDAKPDAKPAATEVAAKPEKKPKKASTKPAAAD
jgi:putative FmdB family regulatory protein